MKGEIWKDVKGYEGLYRVSNLGRVLSNIKILKPAVSPQGYLIVNLSKQSKAKVITIHQLMAIAFLGHTPCGHKIVVDHINNVKTDNRLENLQIITQRENLSKDKTGGTSEYTGVFWIKKCKKWLAAISINGKAKHLGHFKTELEAHEAYQNALKHI